MSKLTKYLESKTRDVKYNPSGSSYFGFGHRLIRVSDHLPPIQRPEDLYILVSGNSSVIYTVAVFGKIFTFVKLGELKKFIDHWLIIVSQKFRVEDKAEDRRISDLRKANDSLNRALIKAKGAKPIVLSGISDKLGIIPVEEFTVPQQKVIKSFIKQIK